MKDKPELEAIRSEIARYHEDGGKWVVRLYQDHGAEALSKIVGRDDLLECFEAVGGVRARRAARSHLNATHGRRVNLSVTQHGNQLHKRILTEIKGKLRRSASHAMIGFRAPDRAPTMNRNRPHSEDNPTGKD